jgi:hypothetical protein
MIKYDSFCNNIVTKTLTPTVEFKQCIPNWFIQKFLSYMAKGQIKVKDYQGNELKVYYYGECEEG